MLEDERYIGTYVIGKRSVLEVGGNRWRMKDRDKWYIIRNHHPAIVDQLVFEQSKTKQTRYPQPVKKPRDYPLKGKAFCGCCNHALTRTFAKTSYYYCRHCDAEKSKPCCELRVEVSGLEQAVLDTLKIQMEVFLSQDGAASPTGIITERPAYEQQIETLVNEKMRLYESYQMGEIELADYKAQKEILDAELLKAKNAYAVLTAQAKRDQEAQARKAERQSISKELSATDGLTAELVGLLIDKVYVFPDKRIEIAYKVKDFSA